MGRPFQSLLLLNFAIATLADFTTNCPPGCHCFWASGNKQADCSNAHITDIPKTLSTEIQNLDLAGNDLYEITRHAFHDVGLINLKKLVLRECKLITIQKSGLSGLAIMIELDLSKNDLKVLQSDTFRETVKIRWILLNDNKLEKLENGLFNNLPFLQKVDLSNNRIVTLGMKTFMNVPKLNILRLDGNKLEHLKIDTLSALTSLSNLDVHDNPWRCDCYLQPFRNWVISKNLYTSPIACAEPPKVHGKLWKELDSNDFVCRPSIVYLSIDTVLRTSDSNVTISCHVNGNPLPSVNWVLNAHIIDESYRYQGEAKKYYITQTNEENSKWINLTIVEAGSTDNGEYLCVATNPGGVEKRFVTLAIAKNSPGIVPPSGMDNNMLPVLIGVSCTAAILLIILIILCWCCCCKRRSSEKKKADHSNGEALIEGSVIPEMEKSLISAVNPVTKPPRRYEAPPSFVSGATEMSELNKTLLDNDSVFDVNCLRKYCFNPKKIRLYTMGRPFQSLLLLNFAIATLAEFTTNCPPGCHCLWASGNKQADCSNANITDIPKTLSTEIQNLELAGNDLYEITRHAFHDVGLINLKKLVLRECKLITIQKSGLSGLAIMIELDLSKNDLKVLQSDTFRETVKIRWILLNDNKLEKLENGLFNNLPFLQKVDLSNNRIVTLGMKTFMNVPKLNILRLDGNKLEHLKIDTLSALTSLSNLDVHDNPWRCDCYLQPFRNWVISKNLYTSPIACSEPPKVHGKLWKELDSNDFVCRPSIVYPSINTVLRTSDSNVTISCHVNGNPLPSVNWVLNAHIIDESYRYQGEAKKYYITQTNEENSKWVNLTIVEAGSTDNGEYLCVATNPGGVEERVVTLAIAQSSPGIVPPSGMDNNMLPVLIGVSCTAAILLIILIILCWCCCCKRRSSEKKKADNSNGEALIEGSVIPEMEKSLISAVNPVTKPPRRYEAPPSFVSGATEMSELNKTLLDNDSVFAHNDDEKRSLDFDHLNKRSQDTLNVEYGRSDGRAYPPDLLSFPPRAAQISPAASSASTVPDTTRLPPQLNPVSPIHSPIYGMTTNQNLFRTLPYSRSQSPFTAPITPNSVVTPRQGYVTIPRRPRVPSWSSTASTQILPSSEAQEPLYDNLGLRTTADGSSVLSLNKAGIETQFSPMRNRPLPATPAVFQSPHPVYYAPIEEQEPAPSPVPQFNPRNSIASQLSAQLSTPGPQEPVNRMSWTAKNTSTPTHQPHPEPRKVLFSDRSDTQSQVSDNSTLSRRGKPETGSLRRNPIPRDNKDEISSPSKEPLRELNASLNQSGTLGRSGKIPPRPPPKPKKKPSTEVSPTEPLFEDEGEDGTEV